MNEIDLVELKRVQLDIMQALHEFCVDNCIKYSLGCGTMLGAVRHKGYIPWDDDIDVYFMRDDYERLIKMFPKVYKEDFELICLERDNDWARAYARMFNNKTILIEDAREKKRIGIGIDVYAIDYVPDNENEWLKYNKRRFFYQHVFSLKLMHVNKKRPFAKNVIVLLAHIVLLPFSLRTIAKFLNKYAQKNDKDNKTYACECVQGMITGKKRFKAADFDEIIDCQFEDRIFKIMKGYDDYLTNAYGEYMKLPPIEKRVAHHAFHAYRKLR